MTTSDRPIWWDSLASDVNPDFVEPLQPRRGEKVTFRIKHARSAPIKRIFWQGTKCGEVINRVMTRSQPGEQFVWWEIARELKEPEMRWIFLIETEHDQFVFFSRRGVTTFHLPADFDFVILADAAWPQWVPEGPTYQIFPDRFFKAGKQPGVESGEYLFQGHQSRKMDWTQKPLSWDKGFCLDFFNGDLDGIRKKIGYLKQLGIRTVFINPIFAAKTTHRYDCIDFFHVDPHLGGDAALARLSRALHKQGMKLVVDISLNHTGIEHPWAKKALEDPRNREARFYYVDAEGRLEGWSGVKTLPQLNYNSRELRKIMFDGKNSVIRKWLKKPFSIDGWRLDVGHSTGNRDQDRLGMEVFRSVRKAVKAENPSAWIVGEHWTDTFDFLKGDVWDGTMNYFGCCRPLRRFLGESDRYLPHAQPHQHRSRATGEELAEQILQHFYRLPHLAQHMQMNILDSHDYFRWHNWKEQFEWATYRGMVIVQYLLPGTPNLFYGDEIGIEGWCETGEGIRFPMDWNKANWRKSFMKLYKTLNRLKQTSMALRWGSLKVLFANSETFVLARFLGSEAVIGILNKNSQKSRISFPVQDLGLQSVVEVFSRKEVQSLDGILSIELKAKEAQVYKGTVSD